jgi:hypothetical protein
MGKKFIRIIQNQLKIILNINDIKKVYKFKKDEKNFP